MIMSLDNIRQKFELLKPVFNERTERLFAAAEANSLGKNGISIVSKATGVERHRIARGIHELHRKKKLDPDRVRNYGAGRKKILDKIPNIKKSLESLIEPYTRGDPESSLRWTTKSIRKLSTELKKKNYNVSYQYVSELLRNMKYSLQANRKTNEGCQHPDRNAQFEYINERAKAQQKKGYPVLSVDAKKKELVGNFKNNGQEWRPKGEAEKVRVHDFMIKEFGKVCPYGIYDITKNKAWVSIGVSKDTAAFATDSIKQWWTMMGRADYKNAKSIFITADCGGSNGARVRLWKWKLQELANKIKIPISISHFPPGTSKWNKIEHKLFSFISKNWRAKPLLNHAIIVNLISSTTTQKGLKIKCKINKRKYVTGIRITDEQMKLINIKKHEFHGDWNYTIYPN